MGEQIQGAKLQSALGRIKEFDHTEMDMNGFTALGRVLKVHHKSGTADVVLVNSHERITSNEANEGRFAAKILVENSGYDEKRRKAWGTISPLAVGSLVLIGFMENLRKRPVILGALHRPDTRQNVLPGIYPLRENGAGISRREALKRTQIYPSQLYDRVDGAGNREKTFPTNSFFLSVSTLTDEEGQINDNLFGFDYHDLNEKDSSGDVVSPDEEEAQAPGKILYVHRTSTDQSETSWTKVYLDEEGTLRISHQKQTGEESVFSLSSDGSLLFKRKEDGEATAMMGITETGDVTMERGTFQFNTDVEGNLNVSTEGEINLTGKKVTITETGEEE